MKMIITEVKVKIQINSKVNFHENFLANASVTFYIEEGGHFTISGFSIWKSKYGRAEINVEPPGNRKFKYVLFENSVWTRLKKEIKDQYDYADIANKPITTNSN